MISRTLARAGADVAIHYHSAYEKARVLEEEIRGLDRRSASFRADITRADEVERLKQEVLSELGTPEILVTTAVIQFAWQPHPLDQPLEDFEGQFRSCVLQNVLMARAFVPGMVERGGGRIIALNTECSMQYDPSQAAYISGKRGMDGFLRSLARDVGADGITVNQVAPGWTISDRYRGTPDESQPEYEAGVPLKRRGTDQEIANVVLFLASDLSSFVTGAYVPACGGNVMPAI